MIVEAYTTGGAIRAVATLAGMSEYMLRKLIIQHDTDHDGEYTIGMLELSDGTLWHYRVVR